MTIENNGHKITIDMDINPILILIFLEKKVGKDIVKDFASPNFSIVVRPSENPNFTTKEGDYNIIIRKDDGEEIELDMPHRGAKMLYVLTLMCQKVVGGLTNKYFDNERAAEAIKALYDKLYRSGGAQWVAKCAEDKHKVSTFRTHAKTAVEDSKVLDNVLRYWCGFEDEKRTIGNKRLNLKWIRIPNDRIIFEDAANSRVSFEEIMEQLPPFEELFVYRNKTAVRIKQLRSQKAAANFPHS